jgi:hypothetical protein
MNFGTGTTQVFTCSLQAGIIAVLFNPIVHCNTSLPGLRDFQPGVRP